MSELPLDGDEGDSPPEQMNGVAVPEPVGMDPLVDRRPSSQPVDHDPQREVTLVSWLGDRGLVAEVTLVSWLAWLSPDGRWSSKAGRCRSG